MTIMKEAGKRIIVLALILQTAFAVFPLCARAEEENEMPLLKGMFAATELTTQGTPWTQEDWNSAAAQLKEVGMELLVIQYAVQYYSETYKVYYYVPGFDDPGQNINERQNTLLYALNACRDQGLKLYLGLHLAEDMWFSAMEAGFRDVGSDGRSVFLTESAEFSSRLFDDLWEQFGPEYDDVIEGWYLPYEFNNMLGDSGRNRLVEDFYQPLTDHIKKVTPEKKILISPLIYPPMLSDPTEEMLSLWEKLMYDVWAKTRVDIIAPQDGCGWESSVKENLPMFYETMAQAREEAQKVRNSKGWGQAIAWNNPELYSMTGSNTMTMKRFGANMRELDSYVDAHVSFSLHSLVDLAPGKGGTNITNGAFYAAYAYAAEKGSLCHTRLPAPEGLEARTENSFDVMLSWKRMSSEDLELPVAGYRICRMDAGAPDERILLPDVPQPAETETEVVLRDAQLENGHTYRYEIYAYDGCGNLSQEPAAVEISIVDDAVAVRRLEDKTPLTQTQPKLYSLEGEPIVSGDIESLKEGGELRIGLGDGPVPARYLLEVSSGEEQIGLVNLQVSYSPGEGYYFPDKIEVLADGKLADTLYPQRDYGSSLTGKVWLPVSLKGVTAGKVELLITQSRPMLVLNQIKAYGCDEQVTVPEGYREPENLVSGQPVTVNGYEATQNFSPDAHFRGADRLVLDYEEGIVGTEQNLYKGSYATELLTRGSADLPYLSWQEDGGSCGVAGRSADADRSVWFRTINLRGASYDLTVELPTAQSISGISTEWLSDRDAAVFLPLRIEYYGMTRGGTQQLIGTAQRPGQAQIDFDRPISQDNCHRPDTFRYKVRDDSGTVYVKIIARVYPQYPANSHFVRGFCVY